MTGVLHLQSRAYPLHYSSPVPAPGPILVAGHGELRPVTGALGSLAYNPDITTEIDLTRIVGPAITLPGIEIAGCRARVLTGGTVLVVYALRHETDLRGLPLEDLDALDAQTNDTLRNADAPILTALLAAATSNGLVWDFPLRPDRPSAGEHTLIDRRSVRYNCHFVTRDPPWQTDPRVSSLVPGPGCRFLLPFTYAWDHDPATPLDELLTMTEPTDIAVAQMSVLASANLGGRRKLVDLARAHPDNADVHAFRRFLDGVWANYYHLDSYRIESDQGHRSTYLAARHAIGLDGALERADKLLGYASDSLLAASLQRSEELDTRLNRVASALAVVAAGSFGLDAASFLLPDGFLMIRLAAVLSVIMLVTVGLFVLLHPRRRRGATADLPSLPLGPPE